MYANLGSTVLDALELETSTYTAALVVATFRFASRFRTTLLS